MKYFAHEALVGGAIARDVLFDVLSEGTFSAVRAGSAPDGAQVLAGPVLPGMANVHSHAFQRAMAGTAERRGRAGDDFWSWREAMYALANSLDPDTLFALAREVYATMLLAGYTTVAEFHYLHRDRSGAWYGDRAATSRSLVAAAREAGIAICLLPTLYAHADVGGVPLHPEQRRFASGVDDVLEIADMIRAAYADEPDVTVGACAHSLRAVTPSELHALISGAPHDAPIHIHVAEQIREVEAVRAAYGERPVAWLMANYAVDARWCLVHATHLDETERGNLARSGAIAGLCPTTEANLGDGLFPLAPFLSGGGAFGIGSDSNVSISPVEELRWLEYGQRLAARKRIIAAPGDAEDASCGEALYAAAASGGARACGRLSGSLAVGQRADFVVLDPVPGATLETLVDRYVFATDRAAPRDVMVGGRWRVRDKRLVS